ncbi:MarR family winged helix-turn-helix transcriptional regulator [Sphingomonas sp. MMS24-JH45]
MADARLVVLDPRRVADRSAQAPAAHLRHSPSPAIAMSLAATKRRLPFHEYAYYLGIMSDTLGFLIADVSRHMRRRFDQDARRVGATGAQWKTLLVVSRHEGINQGGLAELLKVEPITLCRMIDRLEDLGLVERRRDPADRRAWQIFLTDAATPVLDRLRAHADALFMPRSTGSTISPANDWAPPWRGYATTSRPKAGDAESEEAADG